MSGFKEASAPHAVALPRSVLYPIETAPKDGTWFLAYRGPAEGGTWDRYVIVRWHDEFNDFVWPDDAFDIIDGDIDEKLDDLRYKVDVYESAGTFTHWSPLPVVTPAPQADPRGTRNSNALAKLPAAVSSDGFDHDQAWLHPMRFISCDDLIQRGLDHGIGTFTIDKLLRRRSSVYYLTLKAGHVERIGGPQRHIVNYVINRVFQQLYISLRQHKVPLIKQSEGESYFHRWTEGRASAKV